MMVIFFVCASNADPCSLKLGVHADVVLSHRHVSIGAAALATQTLACEDVRARQAAMLSLLCYHNLS